MHDPAVEHALELLQALGPLRARRMFGGYGIYAGAAMVGLIADGQLYLKTDAQTRAGFEAAGGQAFSYTRRGRDGRATVARLGYCTLPPEAADSPAAVAPWARLAWEAATRALQRRSAAPAPGPRRTRQAPRQPARAPRKTSR